LLDIGDVGIGLAAGESLAGAAVFLTLALKTKKRPQASS
jgi:hypothetical protein